MATDVQHPPESSTGSLLSGIVNDAQDLFKHQLELFKAELKQDVDKAREGMALFSLGAGFGFTGILVLAFALVHLFIWAWPDVPVWVWYALVGSGLTALGVGLIAAVLYRLTKAKPLSETATGLEENVEWKTNPN